MPFLRESRLVRFGGLQLSDGLLSLLAQMMGLLASERFFTSKCLNRCLFFAFFAFPFFIFRLLTRFFLRSSLFELLLLFWIGWGGGMVCGCLRLGGIHLIVHRRLIICGMVDYVFWGDFWCLFFLRHIQTSIEQ